MKRTLLETRQDLVGKTYYWRILVFRFSRDLGLNQTWHLQVGNRLFSTEKIDPWK